MDFAPQSALAESGLRLCQRNRAEPPLVEMRRVSSGNQTCCQAFKHYRKLPPDGHSQPSAYCGFRPRSAMPSAGFGGGPDFSQHARSIPAENHLDVGIGVASRDQTVG
jgi:hypothetical protein